MTESACGSARPDYGRFLGRVSAQRVPSPMREMALVFFSQKRPEETIPLFGGIPNPGTVPFVEARIGLTDGGELRIKVGFKEEEEEEKAVARSRSVSRCRSRPHHALAKKMR